MRISSLFFAVVVVLAVSPNLFAQHSSGGSSSGHSSGGASSSGFSHSSSSTSSAGNHTSTTSTSHSAAPSKISSTGSAAKDKDNASFEKKSSRSFFHPFRKPVTATEFKTCLKAPCPVCPGGARNSAGACVPVSQSCRTGQAWNGFSCGLTNWNNDCSSLARQLSAQKQQMQSQTDYGQSLRYRMLQNQYQQCLMRDRSNRGTYAFNSAFLLDTP